MIQPNELKLALPMKVAGETLSSTSQVWEILFASYQGNLEKVKTLVATCPDLIYAQYNYTPPIHFAVREGHLPLVKYLLENGAHSPSQLWSKSS
jgi:ankyrin repeat protein